MQAGASDAPGREQPVSHLLILKRVAPRHGFEPRFTAPKAAVLPLDDRGIQASERKRQNQFTTALGTNDETGLLYCRFRRLLRLIDAAHDLHVPHPDTITRV